MTRGSLIVFEGLDRAGKSTQCQMLADALQRDGLKVKHMRFPGTFTWVRTYRTLVFRIPLIHNRIESHPQQIGRHQLAK